MVFPYYKNGWQNDRTAISGPAVSKLFSTPILSGSNGLRA